MSKIGPDDDLEPKSQSVDKLYDIIKAITGKLKRLGDPEAKDHSQAAKVSAAETDTMALRGEQVSDANRKVTEEQCKTVYSRLRSENPAWSHTRAVEKGAEELNISSKQFGKYVSHPDRDTG